jgi:cell division protease FtsH
MTAHLGRWWSSRIMTPSSSPSDDQRSSAPESENTPQWRVSPAPDGRGAQPEEKPPLIPRNRPWLWRLFVALLVLNLIFVFATAGSAKRTRVPYQPFFVQQLQAGNVKSISSLQDSVDGQLKRAVRYDPPGQAEPVDVTNFKTQVPAFIDPAYLTQLVSRQDVVVTAKAEDTGRAFWANLLLGVLPTLLFMGFFLWLLRRQQMGGGMMGSFGKSTARRVDPSKTDRVTFDDVAGIDEAEGELAEVVDFLKRPERYHKLGARIPHGVLLYGPPGTGKTLLARAVAGEADAAFFTMSASEFVEAIVGMGASRVRDLFRQAKEAAPSIVFIDELDAIGRSRQAASYGGGNDEREQTLNQILTEMDGFEAGTDVIVLGATNRPEVLDQALLRPGRFDRRIAVQAPDKPGRLEILKIHTREVPLADDVDLDQIAASTPGATGADLALIVNEGALFAARRGHERVAHQDLTDAIEKTILGSERQVVMSDRDRERTAYHESGHALVGMLTPGADPVRKISIIPRGQALGVTLSTPDGDRYGYSRDELVAKIKVSLGGRAAEKVVFDEITTGPESDIQQLTKIARGMVARWGMSDAIGPLALGEGRQDDGTMLPGGSDMSPATQQKVDDEARRIVETAEREVMDLLERERPRLDALAHAVLEHETLDQADAYGAAGVGSSVGAEHNGNGAVAAGRVP